MQIIPHITNEIKSYIYNLARSTKADVVITEIGGTTGDIESQPFLEAIRQVGLEQGRENCCYIHVVLVPYISGSDEYKSKPAQHSCKELQGMGICPDIIVLRADGRVGSDISRKISMFCNVRPDCVIENLTMPSLYECPLMLETDGLADVVARQLNLAARRADLTEWKQLVSRIATRSKTCTIALVGKYVKLHDAYLTVMESLYHAGFENDSKVEIKWVDSEHLADQGAAPKAGRCGRHHHSRRLRRPRHRGYDPGCPVRPREPCPLLRHLPGYADHGHGVCPQCAGLRGRQLQRVRPGGPAQRHRPDARPAGQPQGRHHALGKYPCTVTPGTKMAECYGTRN